MADLWGREARALARREYAELTAGKRECLVCGEWKPLEEFVRAKNCRGGLRNDCKACWVLRQQFRRREARTLSAQPRRLACETGIK